MDAELFGVTHAFDAMEEILRAIAAGTLTERPDLLPCDSPRDCVDRNPVTWERMRHPGTSRYDTDWATCEWLAGCWALDAPLPSWWGDPCSGVGRPALALWQRLCNDARAEDLPTLRRRLLLNDPDAAAVHVAATGVRSATLRRCLSLRIDQPDLAHALAAAELEAPPVTSLCAVEFLAAVPDGGFIVTNPPFESIRSLHRRLGAEGVARYRASSPLCRGAFDLGIPILAACLPRVGPRGLAAVVPATWSSAAYAEPLRDELARRGRWRAGPAPTFAAAVRTQTIHGPFAEGWDPSEKASPLVAQPALPSGTLVPLGELVSLRGGTPGFDAATVAAGLVEQSDGKPPENAWRFITTANLAPFRVVDAPIRFARSVWTRPYLRHDAITSERRRSLYDAPKVVITGLDRRIRAAWVPTPCALGIGLIAFACETDVAWWLTVLNSTAVEALIRLRNPGSDLTGPWRRLDVGRLRGVPVPRPGAARMGAEELADLVQRAADDEASAQRLDELVWDGYRAHAPAALFDAMLAHQERL